MGAVADRGNRFFRYGAEELKQLFHHANICFGHAHGIATNLKGFRIL